MKAKRKAKTAGKTVVPGTAAGEFELISEGKTVAVFSTLDEALKAGTIELGLGNYSVKKVGEKALKVSAPALSLGILHARTSSTVSG